jgi:hypothetical protein
MNCVEADDLLRQIVALPHVRLMIPVFTFIKGLLCHRTCGCFADSPENWLRRKVLASLKQTRFRCLHRPNVVLYPCKMIFRKTIEGGTVDYVYNWTFLVHPCLLGAAVDHGAHAGGLSGAGARTSR